MLFPFANAAAKRDGPAIKTAMSLDAMRTGSFPHGIAFLRGLEADQIGCMGKKYRKQFPLDIGPHNMYEFSDMTTRLDYPGLALVRGVEGLILELLPAMWSVLLCLHLSLAEDSAAVCFVRQRHFFCAHGAVMLPGAGTRRR